MRTTRMRTGWWWAAALVLVLAASCTDDTESGSGPVGTASGPSTAGGGTSTTDAPVDELAPQTLDAGALDQSAEPVVDPAELLAFEVGGGAFCDEGQVTVTPGEVVAIGSYVTMCLGDYDPGQVEETSPTGQVTTRPVELELTFAKSIGSPLGVYRLEAVKPAATYQTDIELVRATEPRVYALDRTSDFLPLAFSLTVAAGSPVELELVGFDPDGQVELAFYAQPTDGFSPSAPVTSVMVETDAFGQAKVTVPTGADQSGRCYHAVADVDAAKAYEVEPFFFDGALELGLDNPHYTGFCVE